MLPILFRSTDQGAPTLNNAVGSVISVLDACLVTGFNNIGISEIVVLGGVATVTTTTAHGLTASQSATIAGATAPALNNSFIVASAPTATTFTVPVVTANTTETPASASVKRTPLGWLKEFSGTNKAIYKMSSAQSYGQRLRVDDSVTGAQGARVFGVEFPTGIDTYVDKFPTETQFTGGGYWGKGANNTTSKFWAIIGDDRFFYYVVESSSYSPASYILNSFAHTCGAFGDINSIKNGESYGAFLSASYGAMTSVIATPFLTHQSLGTGPLANQVNNLARNNTGLVKSVNSGFCHPCGGISGSAANPSYPNPVDNGVLFLEPVLVTETSASFKHPVRGTMPGLMNMTCSHADLPNVLYGEIYNSTDGNNLKAIVFKNTVTSQYADTLLCIKLSPSWR